MILTHIVSANDNSMKSNVAEDPLITVSTAKMKYIYSSGAAKREKKKRKKKHKQKILFFSSTDICAVHKHQPGSCVVVVVMMISHSWNWNTHLNKTIQDFSRLKWKLHIVLNLLNIKLVIRRENHFWTDMFLRTDVFNFKRWNMTYNS